MKKIRINFTRHGNLVRKDIDELSNMEVSLKDVLQLKNTQDFADKANGVLTAMNTFKKIIKKYPFISFQYEDVFRRELYIFSREQVPVLDNFSAGITLIPFDYLAEASKQLSICTGKKLDYPEDISKLKVGNVAIGQVWYDGAEVFSPRHAILHSIDSTASRLLNWVTDFKYQLEKETY